MSTLTTEEQETANTLRKASLEELSGSSINMQALGFKDNKLSEEGAKTQEAMQAINNVAYKVKNNAASDLSKAKAKMNDVSQRYGRASTQYDSAQEKYDDALAESKDAVQRYEVTKNTKDEVASAVVRGMTL